MRMAWALLLHAACLAALTACGPRHSENLDTEFRGLIVARNAAAARADTAALRPELSDDLIWVIGATSEAVGKAELLVAAGTPQNPRPRFDIDSVRARRFGDVAVVDYRRSDHRRVGTFEDSAAWRVFEIFVRNQSRWVLARHNQAWLRRPPVAAITTDSTTLVGFVGHYQIDAAYIDNVHFEGRDLVATATGQTEGAHLVPVSTDAFVPDGVGQLLVFERDGRGRVVGYVQGYPDGQVIRARKID